VFKRVFLFLLIAVLAWLAWELITFPDVAVLAKERPKTTAFMEQRKAPTNTLPTRLVRGRPTLKP